MRRLLLLLVALCFTVSARAAEVGGVKLEDKITLAGQDLVLNGAGIRTKVVFKIYVGSLYLLAKASDLSAVLAKAPRRIQMNLLRDVTADQLIDSLNEGLKDNNTDAEMAAIKSQAAELTTIVKSFGEAKEGSVVTLDFVDGATHVGFNGKKGGSIAGEAFNKALTKIWLGDKPAQADLKKAMLGG